MKYIAAIFFLSISLAGFSQKFNAGMFAGVSASQVDGDSYSGFKKLGLTSGAFVNREISSDIYWQLEIKWVMRGVYEGPTSINPDALYRGTYHYFEIPLSVHYLWNEKIQVEAGFSPEVLIKVKYWDQDGLLDPSQYDPNNTLRTFGLSVFAGIHYWYTQKTSVGIRYTYSAFPFRDPQEWNNPQYRGYFHNVLALSMGFRILQNGM